MKKFGMIIAISQEIEGVLHAFGEVEKICEKPFETFKVLRKNAEIYVALSGAGEIASSSATQYLICSYGVCAVLNFGFVGALDKNLVCKQVVACEAAVHYEYDVSGLEKKKRGHYYENDEPYFYFDKNLLAVVKKDFPEIATVKLASGDKFICDSNIKNGLIKDFGAQICDMEGAGIVITALRNGVPAMSIKVISDNADEKSPVSFSEIAAAGTRDCAKIIVDLVYKLSEREKEKFSILQSNIENSKQHFETIASFKIDHDEHPEGIYLSHVDNGIYTYDIRFKKPNRNDFLSTASAHSIEHLFATVIRNDESVKDKVVYFGPMGCRTGFYLLLSEVKEKEAEEIIVKCFKKCLEMDEVPGSKRKECGNYLDHDIVAAKKDIKEFLNSVKK